MTPSQIHTNRFPRMASRNGTPHRRKSRSAVAITCGTPKRPALRFTPYAWAKLLFLRDVGPTEVGGFGISAADDLLLVTDIELVRQSCTYVSVQFDDESVADFFDRQIDAGGAPQEFGRIWVHTHPGDSPRPSMTDEETFRHAFGAADWSIMFILAMGGQAYARLNFSAGPGGNLQLPVAVDFEPEFAAPDHDAWREEYDRHVIDVDDFELDADGAEYDATMFALWEEFLDRDETNNQEKQPCT